MDKKSEAALSVWRKAVAVATAGSADVRFCKLDSLGALPKVVITHANFTLSIEFTEQQWLKMGSSSHHESSIDSLAEDIERLLRLAKEMSEGTSPFGLRGLTLEYSGNAHVGMN